MSMHELVKVSKIDSAMIKLRAELNETDPDAAEAITEFLSNALIDSKIRLYDILKAA